MTDQKPCLPNCHERCTDMEQGFPCEHQGQMHTHTHAPACPNAEPAPAPCDHVWGDPQNRDGTLKTCQKCGIGGAPAPGYVAPVSIPGSADQVWDKPVPETPEPASVTPASDLEIARAAAQGFVSHDTGMRLIARIEQEKAANAELRAQVKRCHAIMQGLVSSSSPDDWPDLHADAAKELSGQFCPGSCTTSCDADRDADRETIAALRARLAEVSEAAQQVVDVRPDLPNTLRQAVNVLEAILAGDK